MKDEGVHLTFDSDEQLTLKKLAKIVSATLKLLQAGMTPQEKRNVDFAVDSLHYDYKPKEQP